MNPNRQFAKSIREFIEDRQSLERGESIISEASMKDVVVYDNGGKTADRYTVIIGKDAFNMSIDPSSSNPLGVNLYAGEVGRDVKIGSNLGKKVSMNRLPSEVQQAIKQRLKEGMYESVVNEELTGNEPPYQLELTWKRTRNSTTREKIGSFVVDDKTYDRLRHWFWDDFVFNVVGWKAKGRLSSFDDIVKVAMNTKKGKIPAVRADVFGLLQK